MLYVMQGKRTDYCKVRIEVLIKFVSRHKILHTTRETREYYLCLIYRMSCDDPSLLRWIRRIQTIISFATFSIIYLIWRSSENDFSLYMLHFLAYFGFVQKIRWQCLCVIIILIISSLTGEDILGICSSIPNSLMCRQMPCKSITACGSSWW